MYVLCVGYVQMLYCMLFELIENVYIVYIKKNENKNCNVLVLLIKSFYGL